MAISIFNFLLGETSRDYLRRAKSPPNRELKPSSPRSGSGEAVWGRFLFWSEVCPAVAVAFCSAAAGFSVVVAARRGILWRSVRGAALFMIGAMPRTALAGNTGARFPFALAILTGSMFALWWPV